MTPRPMTRHQGDGGAHEDRPGLVVAGHQVGREDLGEVPELGHDDDGEGAERDATARADRGRLLLALVVSADSFTHDEVERTAGEERGDHRLDPPVGEELEESTGQRRPRRS